MKILERELGSIDFAENQTRTLPLPRNYAYKSLQLKLVATLYRAAGATAGDPKDCCPAQLVKNIMIRANGRDVIKNYDMESLHRMNQLRWSTRPHVSFAGFAGHAAILVGAAVELTVHAQIDFAMWRSLRPIDSLLDSAGLATLEMIVTWGTGDDTMTDAYDPAAGGVTVSDATLYVASQEYVGVPAGTRFITNKEYMIRSQVTAISARHQIQLPVSNMYRAFILKTHSDGVQVNTILNTITLQSGTEVFKYRHGPFLQMDNRLEVNLEVPEVNGSAAAVDHYFLEHVLEGYYLLEFCKDGHLTEALDTNKLSSMELILDVAHPGTNDFIDIYPAEMIMPPVQVKSA